MKKRAETCVKVVYRILPKPHNPSEIKGSERTHAKTLDFMVDHLIDSLYE